ncbi:hypothetical protein FRC07_006546, partial [Ceratobasidium sp. 392]
MGEWHNAGFNPISTGVLNQDLLNATQGQATLLITVEHITYPQADNAQTTPITPTQPAQATQPTQATQLTQPDYTGISTLDIPKIPPNPPVIDQSNAKETVDYKDYNMYPGDCSGVVTILYIYRPELNRLFFLVTPRGGRIGNGRQ